MKILLTGSRGYLGCVLLPLLKASGHEVVEADLGIYDLDQPLSTDPDQDVRRIAVAPNIEAVIHLAAIVGEPACMAFTSLANLVNRYGTHHLLDEIDGRQTPFIHASTCSVYGASNHVLFEDSLTKPLGPYAQTRLDAEQAALAAGATALRFGTLFGWSPKPRFDLVLNQWARDLHEGRKIEVFGGKQWRPFLHVTDAAKALLFVLEESLRRDLRGEVYNAASFCCTLLEGGNSFRKITDCDVEVLGNNDDPRNYRVSTQRLSDLGFNADHDLETGITEMLDALAHHPGLDLHSPRYSALEALKKRFNQP